MLNSPTCDYEFLLDSMLTLLINLKSPEFTNHMFSETISKILTNSETMLFLFLSSQTIFSTNQCPVHSIFSFFVCWSKGPKNEKN